MATVHGKHLGHTVVATALEEDAKVVDVAIENEMVESTAAGDVAKEYLAGLYSWGMDAEYNWNRAAGKNAAVLYGIIGSGEQTVEVTPGGGAEGANNPSYTGSAILKSYVVFIPHDGVIISKASYEGSGALTRDVT